MKLYYITIMVKNLEKSLDFYENLVGLKVIRRINAGKGEIAFLANSKEETMIELIEFEGIETVQTKGLIMSYLVENDLEALREKALELGYSPSSIIDEGKKPKHFTVKDPDGISVEFGVKIEE